MHESIYHNIIGPTTVGSSSSNSSANSSSSITDCKATNFFDPLSQIWSSSALCDTDLILPIDRLSPYLSSSSSNQQTVQTKTDTVVNTNSAKPIGYERHGKQQVTNAPSTNNNNLAGQFLNLNLNEQQTNSFYNPQKQFALINPISAQQLFEQPKPMVKKHSIGSQMSDLGIVKPMVSQTNYAPAFQPPRNNNNNNMVSSQWNNFNQTQQQQAQFDLFNTYFNPQNQFGSGLQLNSIQQQPIGYSPIMPGFNQFNQYNTAPDFLVDSFKTTGFGNHQPFRY